jgi:NAD(P)H-quinone oxidoreductase subunit 4
MVRQVFHGDMADQMCDLLPVCDLNDLDLKAQGNQEANCFGTDCLLPEEAQFKDANPREIFIAACFLGLIIAIGCYPKMATQMYDVKTIAVNAHVRAAYHQAFADGLQGSVQGRWNPAIAAAPSRIARISYESPSPWREQAISLGEGTELQF